MEAKPSLYEEPLFRRAAGPTLRPGGLDITREALAISGWPAGAEVAEAGCGAGATLKLLAELGYRARGFDLSRDLVAEAAAYSGCPVELADVCDLPVEDASLDGVVCECVVSLLPEPEEALAEFARVLRPGGGLLLADVSKLPERPDRPAAAPGDGTRRSCLEGAVLPEETVRRLEANGFRVVRTIDRTEALTALAVQLVWEGCGLDELGKWLGFSCGGAGRGRFGYTQWLAVKAS